MEKSPSTPPTSLQGPPTATSNVALPYNDEILPTEHVNARSTRYQDVSRKHVKYVLQMHHCYLDRCMNYLNTLLTNFLYQIHHIVSRSNLCAYIYISVTCLLLHMRGQAGRFRRHLVPVLARICPPAEQTDEKADCSCGSSSINYPTTMNISPVGTNRCIPGVGLVPITPLMMNGGGD